MSNHVTIHISAHNEHAVLPRIILIFSRRRLRMNALQMFDLEPSRPAEIQIDLDCPPELARDVVAQLKRIVEVCDVRCESNTSSLKVA